MGMNNTMKWTNKAIILEGGAHGNLLQGSQFPITSYLQDNCLTTTRGNRILISVNSQHAIV